jgi:hypothetical protein
MKCLTSSAETDRLNRVETNKQLRSITRRVMGSLESILATVSLCNQKLDNHIYKRQLSEIVTRGQLLKQRRNLRAND